MTRKLSGLLCYSACPAQEAAAQFASLQADLKGYLEESEAVKEAKAQADER